MENEKDRDEELRKISPDFPRKEKPQSPPEGYFENFPDRILNRWKEEQSYRVKSRWNWQYFVRIAAMVIAVVAGSWLLIKGNSQKQNHAITAQEAYLYIHENIDEFVELIEPRIENTSYLPAEIPASDVEQYLIDELGEEEIEEELFN